MMIDSNMIKVLWIEDDLKVYKAFRGTASLYNIEFIHADNWIDGKQLLKEQFNEISAIILDAQCKWDKNSIAEDQFLNEVMSELWELFGEVRKTIPWYILSAGTMNDYAKVIANANSISILFTSALLLSVSQFTSISSTIRLRISLVNPVPIAENLPNL